MGKPGRGGFARHEYAEIAGKETSEAARLGYWPKSRYPEVTILQRRSSRAPCNPYT